MVLQYQEITIIKLGNQITDERNYCWINREMIFLTRNWIDPTTH